MVRRVTTRRVSEQFPSSEAIVRRITNQKHPEPLVLPPAPPSSPSSPSASVSFSETVPVDIQGGMTQRKESKVEDLLPREESTTTYERLQNGPAVEIELPQDEPVEEVQISQDDSAVGDGPAQTEPIPREHTRHHEEQLMSSADQGALENPENYEFDAKPSTRQTTSRRPTESREDERVPTMPSPDIPDRSIRQVATRRPTRRDREPSTVDERSPPRSPAYTHTPTRMHTDQPVELEGELTNLKERSQIQAELEESSSPSSIEEELILPSRRSSTQRPTDVGRKITEFDRQPTLLHEVEPGEIYGTSIYSEQESEPKHVGRQQSTISTAPEPEIPRRETNLRTFTGLAGLTTSASEPREYASMVQVQQRAVTRKSTLERVPTTTEAPEPLLRIGTLPARQSTQLADAQLSSISSEGSEESDAPPVKRGVPEAVEAAPSRRVPNALAQASRPSSRRPTVAIPPSRWSTEALRSEPMATDDEPSVVEVPIPEFDRQASIISRKPTSVSRTRTEISLQPTIASRKATLRDKPVASNAEDTDEAMEQMVPVERRVSRAPTVISRQSNARSRKKSLPDEEPSAIASRRTTSQISRQPTRILEQEVVVLSSDGDEDISFTLPMMRKVTSVRVTSRQSTRALTTREPKTEELEEPLVKLTPKVLSRRTTVALELDDQPTLPYENSLLNPKREEPEGALVDLKPSVSSRRTTIAPELDDQPTLPYEDSLLNGEPESTFPVRNNEALWSVPLSSRDSIVAGVEPRKPTFVEQNFERESDNSVTSARKEPVLPLLSLQLTRTPTAPGSGIITRALELESRRLSTQGSLLDEPLAELDVYKAMPTSPDNAEEEVPAPRDPVPEPPLERSQSRIQTRRVSLLDRRPPVTQHEPPPPPEEKAVGTQAEPTAFEVAESALSEATQPRSTPPKRPTTITKSVGDVDLEGLPGNEKDIPEEEAGRMTGLPTGLLPRNSASVAPPEDSDKFHADSTLARRRKKKILIHRVPRTANVLGEPEPSSAPGVVAPSTRAVPGVGMPTAASSSGSRVQASVPPSNQYPPAPPYPERDTPEWTRPDSYTPPPKPKLILVPKSKAKDFFRWGKPKKEPLVLIEVPQDFSLEPFHGLQRNTPFRSAAPGKRRLRDCVDD
jgi:hypothetical protein